MTFEQNQPGKLVSDGQIVAAVTGAVDSGKAEIQPAPEAVVEVYVAQIIPDANSTIHSPQSPNIMVHQAIFLPPDPGSHIAIAGAVGGAGLGIWTIVTGFLTPFALLNAVPGILFSLWGLSSPKKKLARIALILNVLGMIIAAGNAVEWNRYFGVSRDVPRLEDPDRPFDEMTE